MKAFNSRRRSLRWARPMGVAGVLITATMVFSVAAHAEPHEGSGHHPIGGHPGGGHAWAGAGMSQPGYASNAGYAVHASGGHYWYQGGHWYHPYGGRWIIGGPPFGAFVPWLPWGYSTLWVSGTPYYYYNNAYYVYRNPDTGYEVVPPPEGAAAAQEGGPGPESDNVFAYPRNGQSAEQQATDRYECHKWANEQTGYDPTQAGGGVSGSDAATKRSDYFRAMMSCLEGRGYSAR